MPSRYGGPDSQLSHSSQVSLRQRASPRGGAAALTARKHPGRAAGPGAAAEAAGAGLDRWQGPAPVRLDFGEEAVIVGESTQRTAFGDNTGGARTEQQGTDVA